MLTVSHLFKDW